jgi:hypothetical protein
VALGQPLLDVLLAVAHIQHLMDMLLAHAMVQQLAHFAAPRVTLDLMEHPMEQHAVAMVCGV